MSETKMQKRFKRWFKPRFAIMYPLGFWILFTGYSTDASIRYSFWFILAGIGMRVWANGYAIKMDRLTTCGPYGRLRHPLYLGSFLILMGFLLMLRIHWTVVFLITLVIVGVIYQSTIKHEETILKNKFGETYDHYKAQVPAFFPWFKAYQGGDRWPWSFERFLKSQEYKIVIWMCVLAIVFYLKEEFLVEHEALKVKHIVFISIAVALALIDLVAEYYRKKINPPLAKHE